jgi:predicted porin
MKKSLLALAVLGAFAGAASAQSSVSISGSVDAGITGYSDDWKVAGSQSSANQINFAGREDLGGGMSAFFVLTHRFRIQDGKANTSTGNPGDASNTVFWRNSFVGLASGFGDVRVGRMLMPLQDMNGGFDAFDTGYVGSTHTGGLTATVRANGAIYYRSPNLGGFSFHAAVAPGEGQYLGDTAGSFATTAGFSIPTALLNSEQPMGASVRYAAGPFNVGLAYDKNTADYDTVGLYGSWDFGGWKLFGQWENGTINNAAGTQQEDVDIYSISTKIPMGAFVFKAGYVWADSDRSNGDVSKFGLGAEYMLSKRTSLYSNLGKADGDRVTGSQDEVRFDIGFTHKF